MSEETEDRPAVGASCPACGAAAPADQRFCGQCGAPLARVCAACGTQNPTANRFCGQCGAALTTADPRQRVPTDDQRPTTLDQPSSELVVVGRSSLVSAQPPAPDTRHPPREERRWATVLFADLSGFTAMSERMDPEDVRTLVQRCAEQLAGEVRRFDGTVVTILGDGLLAVFGAPLAHGDDAERAVRAGLAMLASAPSIDVDRPIQLHVGINTGEVMAGLVGPEERRDYTVLGDTVNTADRIARAAPPGTLLVGEETFQVTRRTVRYRELPPVIAKGKEGTSERVKE